MVERIVRLTAEDALQAVAVAALQMMRKVTKDRQRDHGYIGSRGMKARWADGILGAMGELALSRLLHLEWTPGGMHISRGDVGGHLEVRSTDWPSGHLIVYEDDSDDSLYALMIGHWPEFRCAGCMRGSDAKQAQWWRADTDPPCFMVPQSELHDIVEHHPIAEAA